MPLPRSLLRMTPEELEDFLCSQRTCRIATVSEDGEPHVVPLCYVWHEGALWVTSLRKSRRASDLASGSRAAVCVDAGEAYSELKGAVLYGRFESAVDEPELDTVRGLLGAKYWSGIQVPDVRSHTWLVLRPDRLVSWDFAKIPNGRDRRREALRETD